MAINISLVAGAGAQFFDDSGTPLAGGKIYTYLAGTTTLTTTYTTRDGVTPNANPIILDAGGRPPNEIWLTGGMLYKYVVKTSADALIGTYDNLPSVNDPTVLNTLITVTGSNTLLGTSAQAITGYATGEQFTFVAVGANTGAATLNIDSNGAKNIYKNGTLALAPGDLTVGKMASVVYDGTQFQLINPGGAVALITVTGTDTIAGTASPAVSAYAAGQVFNFVAAGANTGAATLNISSLGAKSITKYGAQALNANDITTGKMVQVIYDGTQFQLLNPGMSGPAFSVNISGNQTVSAGVATKLNFDIKVFDTNTNFSTTTRRFTPTVAGYYQINLSAFISGAALNGSCYIYKNGSTAAAGNSTPTPGGAGNIVSAVSNLIYCNGSTDYIEGYAYSSDVTIASSSYSTYMTGFLARAA